MLMGTAEILFQPDANRSFWRGLWQTLILRCGELLTHQMGRSSKSIRGAYEQPTRPPTTPQTTTHTAPQTQTFTRRQKHALELEHWPRADAAREMGFEGTAAVTAYCKLLARAKLARAWRNGVVEDYLEPRR
jgi:hypothetical protein